MSANNLTFENSFFAWKCSEHEAKHFDPLLSINLKDMVDEQIRISKVILNIFEILHSEHFRILKN